MSRRTHHSQRPYAAVQRGVTLIELMVSIAITLIIVAALITLYLNVTQTNREMVKVNRQIESGRLAVYVLENEVAHAGFWENYMPQFDDLTLTTAPADVPTGAAPAPCLPYTPANWTDAYKRSLLDIPLQSYADVPAGCSAVVTNKKANTDVLVVRHADTCVAVVGGSTNCEADIAGKLYFQSSLCATQTPSAFELNTIPTTDFTTIRRKDCTTAALKRKFISDIYYIRDYAETVGDGIPTLVRSRFDLVGTTLAHQEPVPLIEGIEGFRVELGLDTLGKTGLATNYTQAVSWADATNKTTPTDRGDGSPDGAFVHCTTGAPCTADQFINAVAVKLHILARSAEASPGHTDSKTYTLGSATLGPFNDHFKRHVFATTVRLTNVTGRRETP
ncbi:pilus assembly protein PilW [Variovorax sp. WS11]|uniref:PilW family protein n=1 Tax=Variovorax sp. WS11 TaxID=1105204 RepID=UPI000D0CBD5B|nr:PilW family protein [Variovorax sp. WS11]NDZ12176.1 prepilin-type N-terminal cleavage/methylation domain-containing protein [Variovorax sp. WS11]PSL80385.1 pilus assembly protein PilW [Variovorax sp. WS11]